MTGVSCADVERGVDADEVQRGARGHVVDDLGDCGAVVGESGSRRSFRTTGGHGSRELAWRRWPFAQPANPRSTMATSTPVPSVPAVSQVLAPVSVTPSELLGGPQPGKGSG